MKEEIKVLLFAHDCIENPTETINKLLGIVKPLNKKKSLEGDGYLPNHCEIIELKLWG